MAAARNLYWLLFIALAVASYRLALWLRSKRSWAVWAGLAVLLVVDVVIYLNFPATPNESNLAAILVIAGTGGYLCAALVEPVRKLAKWLEEMGFNP